MFDMTLIRSLNNGQGHSFWCQSISHIRLPQLLAVDGLQEDFLAVNSNFCSITHRLATIHCVQTDATL